MTYKPSAQVVGGSSVVGEGLPGSPRTQIDYSAFNTTTHIAAWTNKTNVSRVIAGHGQAINTIRFQITTTHATETVAVGYIRQPAPGPLSTAATVIASSGAVPTPAVGFASIALGTTITVDCRTDWMTLGASMQGPQGMGPRTSSTNSNLVPHKFGSEAYYDATHPLVVNATVPSTTVDRTGQQMPAFPLIGVMV